MDMHYQVSDIAHDEKPLSNVLPV